MAQEIVLLAIHGMGDTKTTFADKFKRKLSKELGGEWLKVYFDTVYYQSIFQPNEDRVFKQTKKLYDIDSIWLRKFLLFGFSDAAGLERNAHDPGSPYEQAQEVILESLDKAFDFLGGVRPVVCIAQSLGCQVLSNYIWDAQSKKPKQGIWKGSGPSGAKRGSPLDKFRRLKSLKFVYTTGCNIPIFVSGFTEENIKAVATSSKGYSFRWKNFYDPDDALGWPLKSLSRSFKDEVYRDYAINAGGIFKSWNPLSHTGYWTDDDVLEPLANDIRKLLQLGGGGSRRQLSGGNKARTP